MIWRLRLAFNGLGLVVLLLAAGYLYCLSVRNALFTQEFDSEQLPSEKRLNASLETSRSYDPTQLQMRSLLRPEELANLEMG